MKNQKKQKRKRKMKLKTLTVLILLNSLITMKIFSQESKNYKQIVLNEFGIDLKKNYNGETVAEIIAICLEEKDTAIETAYNEGYKAGVIEFKPEIEALKTRINLLNENNDYLKTIIQDNRKTDFKQNILFSGLGFAAGTVTGCILIKSLSP